MKYLKKNQAIQMFIQTSTKSQGHLKVTANYKMKSSDASIEAFPKNNSPNHHQHHDVLVILSRAPQPS